MQVSSPNAAFNTGAAGMTAAFDAADRAARQVVSGAGPTAGDPAGDAAAAVRAGPVVTGVTGLMKAELQLSAAAAVTRAADEMTGALLDIVS